MRRASSRTRACAGVRSEAQTLDAGSRVLQVVAASLRAAAPFPALSVAYSGGVDSTVLLEAVHRLVSTLGLPRPRALHVDHGLAPGSGDWREHCRAHCARRGIPFVAMQVDATASGGESPEAVAREQRYRALSTMLSPAETVCIAQHSDDQAESVLLALLRGAGVHGLAGMGATRALAPGLLLRPLLGLRRAEIEACARAWRLQWIEDPSNQHLHHPRNRLRHDLLPALEAIAPGAVRNLSRSARLQAEAAQAVDDLARLDLAACRGTGPGALSLTALAALPERRRLAVLRLWLRDGGMRPPGEARLREAARQFVQARGDRNPRLCWSDGELRAGAGQVVALRGCAPAASCASATWSWSPGAVLELPGGRLWGEACTGVGLNVPGPLEVRLRRGGERCRPAGRRHSQSLKRLLQERRVPSWERAALPLLYSDGVLIAVADLWVCEGHQAAGSQPGWRIRWAPSRREVGGDACAPGRDTGMSPDAGGG